jgi:hypothetical protein
MLITGNVFGGAGVDAAIAEVPMPGCTGLATCTRLNMTLRWQVVNPVQPNGDLMLDNGTQCRLHRNMEGDRAAIDALVSGAQARSNGIEGANRQIA